MYVITLYFGNVDTALDSFSANDKLIESNYIPSVMSTGNDDHRKVVVSLLAPFTFRSIPHRSPVLQAFICKQTLFY
jgi:hypothetical protein